MAEYPALPLFTDAFISDTLILNAEQTGAYLMLLMAAWRSSDCMLPSDDKMLASMARMTARSWAKNRNVILSFWHVAENGKFYQRRLLDERERVNVIRARNSVNGRLSALKRKGRHSTTASTKPQPKISTHTHTHTHTQKKEDKPPTPFEEFWAEFPRQRRGSRDKALVAYTAALKRTTPEELNAATRRYAECDDVKRGFAKGAAAWLNDDRWTDEHRTAQSSANGKPAYADSIKTAAAGASDMLREKEKIRAENGKR